MDKPAPADAPPRRPAAPFATARPLGFSGRRLRLGILAAAPLLLVGLVVGGASARTGRPPAPSVFEPTHGLRLEPSASFRAHTPWVRTLAFRPDGRTLASGGSDGKLRTWILTGGARVTEGTTWSNPEGAC